MTRPGLATEAMMAWDSMPCRNCGAEQGLMMVERGQHTTFYRCSCGNAHVKDHGCHSGCGCVAPPAPIPWQCQHRPAHLA